MRPRCGILNPGETVAVSILLKPEHLLSDNGKDKFLIMCMPSMDIQSSQVAEFWKKVGQQSVNMEQHRLYCTYKDVGTNAHQAIGNGGVNSGSSGDKKEDHMSTVSSLDAIFPRCYAAFILYVLHYIGFVYFFLSLYKRRDRLIVYYINQLGIIF